MCQIIGGTLYSVLPGDEDMPPDHQAHFGVHQGVVDVEGEPEKKIVAVGPWDKPKEQGGAT